MKNSLFITLIISCFFINAQEKETWRIGLTWGIHSNNAKLIGGSENADSRFEQRNSGNGALTICGRYDYTKQLMLTAGLGVSGYGFDFSLAQNYSLLNPESRMASIKYSIGLLELPVMIHYKFNPDCRNKKWVVGCGIAQNLQTGGNQSGTYNANVDSKTTIEYFNAQVVMKGALFPTIKFSVGKEKYFENGSLLNWSMLLNLGFDQRAIANVSYSIDGKSYNHRFGNKSDYFGLRMTYYFKAL